MINDILLEKVVKDLFIELCGVMYKRGFQSVSIGAIMRLIGIDNERSSRHDDQMFVFDDDFLYELHGFLNSEKTLQQNSTNKTVH